MSHNWKWYAVQDAFETNPDLSNKQIADLVGASDAYVRTVVNSLPYSGRPSAVRRYQTKVGRPNENGCQPWTGPRNREGYGQFSYEGKTWRAHRWGWTHYIGPIHEGLVIRHACDYPRCQNLDHLLLGTHAENSADMVARGRGKIKESIISDAVTSNPDWTNAQISEATGASRKYVARVAKTARKRPRELQRNRAPRTPASQSQAKTGTRAARASAKAESIHAVSTLHPDWTNRQIADETGATTQYVRIIRKQAS